MSKANFNNQQGTSDKGASAEYVVKEMVKRGIIPLVLDTTSDEDYDSQLLGSDILVKFADGIQAKCDWRGGHREHGGTGNLFLQTDECNPLGQH
jgi:hypothetical protein